MNKEEYEIIFVAEEGRAILNKKTKKIYYSEFEIIEEKDKEISRLNNIINELEKHIGTEWYCFDNESVEFAVAKDILDKLKELKGDK